MIRAAVSLLLLVLLAGCGGAAVALRRGLLPQGRESAGALWPIYQFYWLYHTVEGR